MTGIKKRAPTNKEFKGHFQGLAGTRVKKGHLNNQEEKKPEDNAKENGELIRIHKKKLYEKGWEVKVGTGKDAVTYMCSYGDAVLCIPDSNITEEYYIPKNKTNVEVTIDKKSKIYTVTKINSPNVKPIALYEDNLVISTNTNTDTNSKEDTAIEVSKKSVNIKSSSVTITDADDNTIDLFESHDQTNQQISDLQKTTDQNKQDTDQQIADLKEQNALLISRIEVLEDQIQDDDADENQNENKDTVEGE
ncbi:MAG: hypothetical protein IJ672_04415 [Methanobrevibacter sp.]|nr:hypothetical protein [Methanobrevibacter sp.]